MRALHQLIRFSLDLANTTVAVTVSADFAYRAFVARTTSRIVVLFIKRKGKNNRTGWMKNLISCVSESRIGQHKDLRKRHPCGQKKSKIIENRYYLSSASKELEIDDWTASDVLIQLTASPKFFFFSPRAKVLRNLVAHVVNLIEKEEEAFQMAKVVCVATV